MPDEYYNPTSPVASEYVLGLLEEIRAENVKLKAENAELVRRNSELETALRGAQAVLGNACPPASDAAGGAKNVGKKEKM
uniref:Uncharacterized protein n=1 Tax=Meloidogyne incognita TaxID=6306 RepID=A0A914LYW2_MELIC